MEGITIVAINHATSKSGGQKAVFAHITGTQDANKWIFSNESLNCNVKSGKEKDTILNGSFVEFRVALILSGVGAKDGKNPNFAYNVSVLDFTLHFDVPSLDNWYLQYATLHNITIVKGEYLDDLSISDFDKNATTVDAKPANIRGFYGYSYGCSATPAIFFESDKHVSIGLQFNNFQIEPYNIYINNDTTKGKAGVQFRSNVNDCVPTFTVGSLMSIISVLVLFVVFIFGFLMLNSVQTMDRFDDPKGKQIIINTKE
uniref:V-type proton ATPase subunit S1/VOA1 transmembrane domain-containing protein n=1 Tax=Acrobeloides nanus TaxID=290746 RepID=A0A914C3K5_9BILA